MSEQPADPSGVIDLGLARGQNKVWAALAKTDKGAPLATLANILIILRHDPVLAGMIHENQFTYETAILRPPPPPDDSAEPMAGPYPRPWTDADEALILAYIQRRWISKAAERQLQQGMTAEAAMRGFHPIRDWLGGLKWDGQKRLEKWLHHVFGAADDPYHSDVGVKFLVASVRRIRQPGCKFDYMPVFEGEQGIGKSTALKLLFGEEWFSDSITQDLANKDAAINLLGVWCLEMAEIAQMVRAEVETIKAFLSRSIDKYRPPFGRRDVVRRRQGVLAGTTNDTEYLRDITGNRRIWPVKCLKADWDYVKAHREQLWAEACAVEDAGESIWLEDAKIADAAAQHQADRLAHDPWHDPIERYVAIMSEVTVVDILRGCIDMPMKDHNRAHEMRVGKVLTTLGWRKGFRWDGQKNRRIWIPPPR